MSPEPGLAIGIDWTLINSDVAAWAQKYSGKLVKGITKTTRKGLGTQLEAWVESGEPLPGLFKRLETLYSPKRAELIGITEATKAYAHGNELLWKSSEVVKGKRWNTANDERVCPICGPLNDQVVKIGTNFEGGIDNPPAHPRCRCWITPVVVGYMPEAKATGIQAEQMPIFKTNKEMEAWAQEHLHTELIGSLKGVNTEYANRVLGIIYDIEQRIVELPGAAKITFTKIKGTPYAQFRGLTKELRFRKSARLNDVIKRMQRDDLRWQERYPGVPFHANNTVEGLVWHEYGHLLDWHVKKAGRKLVLGLPLEEKRNLLKVSGYTGEGLYFGMSPGAEAFAEAVSAIATKSPQMQYVPPSLRDFIMGLLR